MTGEREGLVEVVYAILAEFPMSDDGTGHIADCGYTFLSEKCDCYTLPTRLADLLAARDRRVRAEALREAADEAYARFMSGKTLGAPTDVWLRDRANRDEGDA